MRYLPFNFFNCNPLTAPFLSPAISRSLISTKEVVRILYSRQVLYYFFILAYCTITPSFPIFHAWFSSVQIIDTTLNLPITYVHCVCSVDRSVHVARSLRHISRTCLLNVLHLRYAHLLYSTAPCLTIVWALIIDMAFMYSYFVHVLAASSEGAAQYAPVEVRWITQVCNRLSLTWPHLRSSDIYYFCLITCSVLYMYRYYWILLLHSYVHVYVRSTS